MLLRMTLRVSLIEAYNSIYNYDLIGIFEAYLDNSIDEGRLSLNGYTFIKKIIHGISCADPDYSNVCFCKTQMLHL